MTDRSSSALHVALERLYAGVCSPWGVMVLVVVVTAARLSLLSSELAPPPMPDEALFWLMGQSARPLWPENGPLLPWLLGLLSDSCGPYAPCLRLLGPVAHGLAMWFVYRLGVRLFDVGTGFWCAVLYGSLPLVLQGGLVVGPMALVMPMWSAALLMLAGSHAARGLIDWVAMGACIGLGLLVHPVMALFVPLAALYLWLSPDHRGVWRRPGPYVALLVMGLCLLPVLIGAAADEWAAARRLVATLAGPPADFGALWPTMAWGAVLAGPVLAGVLAWLVVRAPLMLRDGAWTDYRVRLLLLFSVPVLVLTLALTLVRDEGAMLTALALPAALVMVCGWLSVQGRLAWLVAGVALNSALAVALLTGPHMARQAGWRVPAAVDIAAVGHGYDEAGPWLEAVAEVYPDTPIGIAGAGGPMLAHRAAVRGVSVQVLGAGASDGGGAAFSGLLVMPAALAEAAGADSDIRARLSVILPDGRRLAWAAALIP